MLSQRRAHDRPPFRFAGAPAFAARRCTFKPRVATAAAERSARPPPNGFLRPRRPARVVDRPLSHGKGPPSVPALRTARTSAAPRIARHERTPPRFSCAARFALLFGVSFVPPPARRNRQIRRKRTVARRLDAPGRLGFVGVSRGPRHGRRPCGPRRSRPRKPDVCGRTRNPSRRTPIGRPAPGDHTARRLDLPRAWDHSENPAARPIEDQSRRPAPTFSDSAKTDAART